MHPLIISPSSCIKKADHQPQRIFWRNNAAGIVNHGDFYETIAANVDIYYDDIASLSSSPTSPSAGTITLTSTRTLTTTALLLGTGWRPSTTFLSPSLCATLGLPYPLSAEPTFSPAQQANAQRWRAQESRADEAVIKRYPILGNPPEHASNPVTRAPWRLYNLMVPLTAASSSSSSDEEDISSDEIPEIPIDERNFACIGLLNTTNYFRTGEAQALWLTAWFDGILTSSASPASPAEKGKSTPPSLPSPTHRRSAVASFIAWNKRRYLSLGVDGNSVGFDTMRYTDHLLREIGLRSHLPGAETSSARGGLLGAVLGKLRWLWAPNWYRWWKTQYFRPNAAVVYRGLREEYVRLYGGGPVGKVGRVEGKKTV